MPVEFQSRPITIAILAMGGEGGGVLADWIVQCAEKLGYWAQSTSVPGVAQRTGATIYYVEILTVPREDGQRPIFGLMPTPGDVDVVIASELMECGRAIQRGLVTPNRTWLITSSNRIYTFAEKAVPGDGRIEGERIFARAQEAAQTLVCHDFAQIAEQHRSVISASLFGAFAAAGVVPWGRETCEQAIRDGGIGVAPSLAAFAAGFEVCQMQAAAAGPSSATPRAELPASHRDSAKVEAVALSAPPAIQTVLQRARNEFPPPVWDTLEAGVARTANYQDPNYADELLDRLTALRDLECVRNDSQNTLLREAARYLALWMSYEDTARVAQLKMRADRFDRVRNELNASDDALVRFHEYFHPRPEEIADAMPASVGRWLMASTWAHACVSRFTRRGRVVTSSSMGGFLLLYTVYAMRLWRKRSLRYVRETQRMFEWLALLEQTAPTDYALACELAQCPRLIKGYGDTHERGTQRYQQIVEHLPLLKGSDAAGAVRAWREAALADDNGERFQSLLDAARRGGGSAGKV